MQKQIKIRFYIIFIWLIFSAFLCYGQKETAILKGKILSEDGKPIELAVIGVNNKLSTQSMEDGSFSLEKVPLNKKIKILVSHISFHPRTIEVNLNQKVSVLDVTLIKKETDLGEVDVNIQNYEDKRKQISVVKIDPRSSKMMPSLFGDFNKSIATLTGVSSNNELSSSYSVRGGNFDENLVYVNGFQIYRPFLVRSGQQEGLSFVNSDMVGDIEFSAGGWQPRYGDKLSSVLSIQYRKPTEFGGTFTAGRLGGALHLQDISKNERFSYNVGLRYKDSRAALNRLPTQAEFRPRFADFQGYFTWDLTNIKKYQNEKNRASLEFLTSYGKNQYYIEPESKTTTFGALTSSVKRLFVAYDGNEQLDYDTYQGGIKYNQRFNEKLKTSFLISQLFTTEREFFTIESGYRLCDIKIDFSSEENLNKCVFEQDIGTEYKYGRNRLEAEIINLENNWSYIWSDKSSVDFGYRVGNERINDTVSEYTFIDSAEYVKNTHFLRSKFKGNTYRHNFFIQHNYDIDSTLSIVYGARSSYWTWNKQIFVSPRLQLSWQPKWKRDYIFKAAVGIYHQPPFYREMRSDSGTVSNQVMAQRSTHFIAGFDHVFQMWDRDFKFITEVYYKDIQNLIPYDYNDVKIRYRAHNNAKGYARGIDFRISGEFIKDAESWFSLGLLQTREYLFNTTILDADSNYRDPGYVPRPTDQLVTFGMFFQDQMKKFPTVKMYLNLQFGSGLPFNIPRTTKYKYTDSEGNDHQSYGRMKPYRRVDVGFSKMILFADDGVKKSKLKSLWLGFEILNIIGANNTISYSWVKDTYNTTYGIPNYLSARIWNLKMIAKF